MQVVENNHNNVEGKWLLRRDVGGHVIIAKAVAVASAGTWGVTCTIDGEVTEFRQVDNFLNEAQRMIEAAIMLIEPVCSSALNVIAA